MSDDPKRDRPEEGGPEDRPAKVARRRAPATTISLLGHTRKIMSIAWNSDGRLLASASHDHTVRVWDVQSAKQVTVVKHEGYVNSVSWSPDGIHLASMSYDGTVRAWIVASGAEVCRAVHKRAFCYDWGYAAAWSPDGRRLATASDDPDVCVWDAASGAETLRLQGHGDRVRSVAWSPDGRRLASASDDCTARVWNAASGEEVLCVVHEHAAWHVSWSPDGRHLATATCGVVHLWDAESGTEIRCLTHGGRVRSVSWSPDGLRLASVSGDKTVCVWSPSTGACVRQAHIHTKLSCDVSWSPRGDAIAFYDSKGSGSGKHQLVVWRLCDEPPEVVACARDVLYARLPVELVDMIAGNLAGGGGGRA